MEQKIEKFINECMELEYERKQFLIILTLADPGQEIAKYFDKGSLKEGRVIAKKEIKKLGGLDEVILKFSLTDKQYLDKLSELSENLDSVDFNINPFQHSLNERQFRWLKSHIKEIKNCLPLR
jgi:hypothetical protein